MRDSFCGWYFKCQNETRTLAVIPAYHITNGKKSCSIQVITDDNSWNITFPYSAYRRTKSGVEIGGNYFGQDGIRLNLHEPVKVTGSLSFGPFTPLQYDIMGPFKYIPFMECRHSVFSMQHLVNGSLAVDGIGYKFHNGVGYMEGDRGYSFPQEYIWTQCTLPKGSLMLSVADIPFCRLHFTGVICAIHWQGREYRLATYLGARAVHIHDGEVVIRQGRRQLTVRRLEKKGHPLAAPAHGKMSRTIHETAACRAYYRLQDGGRTIFECEVGNAAFEYEYSTPKKL